jgi:26S proteasome regulatory subunit N6
MTDAMEIDEPAATPVEAEEEDAADIALAEKLEDALQEALRKSGEEQIPLLLKIIEEDSASSRVVPIRERAVYDLTRAYCAAEQFTQVVSFLTSEASQSFLRQITKAKTAKVVRHVLDIVCTAAPTQLIMQESVARSILNWTIQEKRSFLRQRVEAKLAKILFHQENYVEALNICDKLLHELKKLDDKQLLVETHLLESKVHFALRNIPKSKAALTASRTAANAIYVSPSLQAEIDSMSGTTHCEEGDYNTAHSYFLEAFEQLDQMNATEEAVVALKYMMLCKILDSLRIALKLSGMGVTGAGTDKSKSAASSSLDVSGMLTAKQGVKYAGRNIEAMSAIAKAASNRNLREFQSTLLAFQAELQQDLLINHHLNILQEQLLESNLIRIIEPYSCVELHHIAKLIEMPLDVVEKKLSQMILDGKFSGILDQGKGQLIVYEEGEKDEAMEKGLQVISNMDAVVTSLFDRSKALRTMMI